jgi:hypothetical protein
MKYTQTIKGVELYKPTENQRRTYGDNPNAYFDVSTGNILIPITRTEAVCDMAADAVRENPSLTAQEALRMAEQAVARIERSTT